MKRAQAELSTAKLRSSWRPVKRGPPKFGDWSSGGRACGAMPVVGAWSWTCQSCWRICPGGRLPLRPAGVPGASDTTVGTPLVRRWRPWPTAARSTVGVTSRASTNRQASSVSDIPVKPPASAPTAAAPSSTAEKVVSTTAARVILPDARHTAIYRAFGTLSG